MADHLRSAWLKLDRAKCHVDALHREVMEATDGDPERIELASRFHEDIGEVIYEAKSLPEIRESYGILVGDAVHNFRCALDHLWWQLATRNLGREPTDDEAKSIQFPILSDPKDWRGHRYLRYVSDEAARYAKPMQPFSNPTGPNQVYFLELLADLSNADKHRSVRIAHALPQKLTTSGPVIWVDCKPRGKVFTVVNYAGGKAIRVGDPVIGIPVEVTGPNPDVKLKTDATCKITIKAREGVNPEMLGMLDIFGTHLVRVIRAFQPLL